MELLGDLAAGLAATDHNHGALGQRFGVPVLLAEQLIKAVRYPVPTRGAVGALVPTRRDDDAAGAKLSRWSRKQESLTLSVQRPDRAILFEGCVEGLGPALEVLDHPVARQEAVRVVAAVLRARQPDRPVGRNQGERVPPPRAPGLGDASGLEHVVVDAELGQIPA